jgi:hypothetical protein
MKQEKTMGLKSIRLQFSNQKFRCLTALLCAALLAPGETLAWAASQGQEAAAPATAAPAAEAKIPADQLDSLVAPIALHPDPLLAQILAASTYPLEIIQLQQWLEKNKNLKDQALVDAVKKQNWDPSIQGLAALPDVVTRLADDIKWTTDLGNAFLAQQADVMDAVQRMRKKAQEKGNLKTTEQQKVETKVVESKTVIVVEQANPQVVYVPSYNPTVVYGPPVYPYPPPPSAGWVAAGMAISFGVGIAMGAAWGGGWGYGCGWGHNDVNVNVNNNFNRNTNISRGGNTTNIGSGNSSWQHNSEHRGGAPYSNSATANKFGGTTRGGSASAGQTGARQGSAQQGGRTQAGTTDRSTGDRTGADRGGAGAGSMDRGGASASSMDRSRGSSGGDQIGNRSVSPSSSSRSSSAFGGDSGRSSGSSARTSSSRGASSYGGGGSRGGGGGSRGGGGRR